jgi:hypothetical protein
MSVPATLEEFLDRHHIDRSAEDFLAELDEVYSDAERWGGPLSAGEAAFLREHSGADAASALASAEEESARLNVMRTANLCFHTAGIAEVALALGVDRSRVSHRIADGSLWAFHQGRSPRIPSWQIADGRVLPGLGIIIRAIPRGITPPALEAFMTAVDPDLGDTPINYLLQGGDPGPVAELVAALGQW